jgi:hypothetical protein
MVLTKSELISALQHEVKILVHLCGKVEPGMLDYRPTPKQQHHRTVEILDGGRAWSGPFDQGRSATD